MRKKENVEFPVLVIRDPELVVFPELFSEVNVGRPLSKAAVLTAKRNNSNLIIAFQREDKNEELTDKDVYNICIESEISAIMNETDGNLRVVLKGLRRGNFKSLKAVLNEDQQSYMSGAVEFLPETEFEMTIEVKDLVRQLKDLLLDNFPSIKFEKTFVASSCEKLSKFVDCISGQLPVPGKQRLKLLRIRDVVRRLESVIETLAKLVKQDPVTVLSEPLEESDQQSNDIAHLKNLINQSGMQGEALKVVQQELKRLSMTAPNSAEFQVIYNYIETASSLPWTKVSKDKIDLNLVKEALDNDHYGLQMAKERVLEFLSVRKLAPEKKGAILCFSGPPGTGKTSIAKSVSNAMGRKLVRISLGGINDEAEIRGHRKTYVGAMPGRIIQQLKRIGVKNPVFVLDELDKICSHVRGDPAAALLEVLDPEQNSTFVDNYLGVPFDLSQVMFIATVNDISSVAPALRDRLEVIDIPSYSIGDKVKIAKNYLIKKQKEENGLKDYDINITDEALHKVVEEYTNESGVRSLERCCGSIMRKMAVKVASNLELPKVIDEVMIQDILGPQKMFAEKAIECPEVGLSTGLAWSSVGGSILFVETLLTSGKGDVILTGNLGKVIQESAKAAHTWIKSNADKLGVDLEKIKTHDVHIHFPAGATPKDGPSAGLAILSSMLSSFLNKPIANGVAMTGEISLRGRVLPIGGLREKVLAAHRAGIKHVIFPEQNSYEIMEIPEEVRNELSFTSVSRIEEALDILIPHNGESTSDDVLVN